MTRSAMGVGLVLILTGSAWAVQPASWSHATEADFAPAKLDKTVLTSLGEVMLARATETLLAPAEKLGMVSAVAVDPRGRVFLAAAPGGVVYRLDAGKLSKFAELPGVLVRHLAFEGRDLIAGTCGKGAGLYRIDANGKVRPIWTHKDVTYVWAVVAGPRGSYYVATGAEGKVYHVRPGRGETVVYDSDDENVLSLAGAPRGKLYAGTGEKGLILQIDPAAKSGRVLYDAPETEISAIVPGPDGTVYAATSDSTKAGAGREGSAGRPQPAGAPAATQPLPLTAPAKKGKESATRPAGNLGPGGAAATRPSKPPDSAKPAKTKPRKAARMFGSRRGRPSATAPGGAGSAAEAAKGNAVYRIDADGLVRAVFRRPVAILDMTLHEDALVLATGHGGQVFAVDLDGDRTSMVVKLDPKDVTALADDGKGKLYLGTADKAAVYALGAGLARKGTLTSAALDGRQIADWGTVEVRAEPDGKASATLATRSGNVAEPDEKTWSAWSAEMPLGKGWAKIASPPGRFLQYRLTLAGDGSATPTVDQVQIVYQVKNLAPVIKAVKITPSGDPEKQKENPQGRVPYRMFQVQAADPNGDPVSYALHFRRMGRKRWIELADKHAQATYAWDTAGVADGVYEVRVKATDATANPPGKALEAVKITRPVVVDNAPPTVTNLVAKAAGKGTVTLTGKVTDTTSRIVHIHYSVNTNTEWTAILPTDGICDSPKETFSGTIPDLPPGTHRLAVRATDEYRNPGYASIEVTIDK